MSHSHLYAATVIARVPHAETSKDTAKRKLKPNSNEYEKRDSKRRRTDAHSYDQVHSSAIHLEQCAITCYLKSPPEPSARSLTKTLDVSVARQRRIRRPRQYIPSPLSSNVIKADDVEYVADSQNISRSGSPSRREFSTRNSSRAFKTTTSYRAMLDAKFPLLAIDKDATIIEDVSDTSSESDSSDDDSSDSSVSRNLRCE